MSLCRWLHTKTGNVNPVGDSRYFTPINISASEKF